MTPRLWPAGRRSRCDAAARRSARRASRRGDLRRRRRGHERQLGERDAVRRRRCDLRASCARRPRTTPESRPRRRRDARPVGRCGRTPARRSARATPHPRCARRRATTTTRRRRAGQPAARHTSRAPRRRAPTAPRAQAARRPETLTAHERLLEAALARRGRAAPAAAAHASCSAAWPVDSGSSPTPITTGSTSHAIAARSRGDDRIVATTGERERARGTSRGRHCDRPSVDWPSARYIASNFARRDRRHERRGGLEHVGFGRLPAALAASGSTGRRGGTRRRRARRRARIGGCARAVGGRVRAVGGNARAIGGRTERARYVPSSATACAASSSSAATDIECSPSGAAAVRPSAPTVAAGHRNAPRGIRRSTPNAVVRRLRVGRRHVGGGAARLRRARIGADRALAAALRFDRHHLDERAIDRARHRGELTGAGDREPRRLRRFRRAEPVDARREHELGRHEVEREIRRRALLGDRLTRARDRRPCRGPPTNRPRPSPRPPSVG